jgi:AAA+ superfamily predicted ATPase
VHRATDAVLAGVDHVARDCANVTFVATTNHEAGVDVAFLSRADAVEQMGLPGAAAIEQILRDTVRELAGADGFEARALATLAKSCADASLDARQVRKLVLRAVTSRRELADDPSRIRVDDVAEALRSERR